MEWNIILQIIMTKTFPKLMQTTNHRFKKLREHQQKNTKKFTLRTIIFKLQKTRSKEKILEEAKGEINLSILIAEQG